MTRNSSSWLRDISCVFVFFVVQIIVVNPQRNQSKSLFPTRSIIANVVDRFLNNDSDNLINVDFKILNTTQLLQKWGLSSEIHQTTTEDGYILEIHRIVPKYANSPPVLIQHGICLASDSWVLRGKEDLAIILHEQGYDVWLTNTRGNCYSKQHQYLNIKEEPYWDFSYHEHGLYDMPASIDHILAVTGRRSLSYIGHSMGTTMFYVMASMRPSYNQKVNLHIGLAPVAYSSRMKSVETVFKPFGQNVKWYEKAFKRYKRYELLERRLANPLPILCEDPLLRPLCYQISFLLLGPDIYQWPDKNIITAITAYFPAGTSFKTLYHFWQSVVSADFKAFDHGDIENMRRFGSFFPPRYNISAITAPIALFYSTNDYLSHPTDVRLLAYQLPNLVGMYKVPFPYFNHLDYVFARDSRSLLYDSVLCLLDSFNNKLERQCEMPTNRFNRNEKNFWRE
uniref:Lipase 1 n=2 Tax=Cacopsylla melanoneura TaxID=428564 RepID=A0A8D8TGD5_9HEMI